MFQKGVFAVMSFCEDYFNNPRKLHYKGPKGSKDVKGSSWNHRCQLKTFKVSEKWGFHHHQNSLTL